MENIVERIVEICKSRNIPILKLEKDLGYGNGYLNPKKVSDMKAGRLLEILDYLGVSTEEFFNIGLPQTQAIETAFAQIKKASPEAYEALMKKWLDEDGAHSFRSPKEALRFALYDGADIEITDEMYDEIKRFAAFAAQNQKSQNKKE